MICSNIQTHGRHDYVHIYEGAELRLIENNLPDH